MDVGRRGRRRRGERWSTVVGHSEGGPVGFVCVCARLRDCLRVAKKDEKISTTSGDGIEWTTDRRRGIGRGHIDLENTTEGHGDWARSLAGLGGRGGGWVVVGGRCLEARVDDGWWEGAREQEDKLWWW